MCVICCLTFLPQQWCLKHKCFTTSQPMKPHHWHLQYINTDLCLCNAKMCLHSQGSVYDVFWSFLPTECSYGTQQQAQAPHPHRPVWRDVIQLPHNARIIRPLCTWSSFIVTWYKHKPTCSLSCGWCLLPWCTVKSTCTVHHLGNYLEFGRNGFQVIGWIQIQIRLFTLHVGFGTDKMCLIY